MERSRSGKDRYRYQIATVSATFAFFFSLAVAVSVAESSLLAIGLSLIVALIGFVIAFLRISQLERAVDQTGEFSYFGSVIMKDQIVTSAGPVLRSLSKGLIAAAVSAISAGVAYVLSVFNIQALPALSLLALATGFVALVSANHTSSLLRSVSERSKRTIWRGVLLRVRVFVLCAAIFAGLAGVVAVLAWLTPRRIYLLDWAAFMTSLFTFYFVIDTRTATFREVRIVARG